MNEIPPLHWRAATPADARALCHLGRATYLANAAADHAGAALLDFLDEAHGEERYRAWLGDPAHALLIGETPAGAPAGYAMLAPADEVDTLELKRCYLLPPWHGTGEADAMLARVLAQAESRSARWLTLAVFESNIRARRFYERHGFNAIGTRSSWLVQGATLILYARDLAPGEPSGQNPAEPLAS